MSSNLISSVFTLRKIEMPLLPTRSHACCLTLTMILCASAMLRAAEPATAPTTAPVMTPDSTTDGSVTVGGNKIEYHAVAGAITVGSTGAQDAAIGIDGRPILE